MNVALIADFIGFAIVVVFYFLGIRAFYKAYKDYKDHLEALRLSIIDIDYQIETLKEKLESRG